VSATSAATPNRRHVSAIAIRGHKDGSAPLGQCGSSFFFLLEWRIFSNLGVEVIITAFLSGFVPSGGSGDRVWRSSIIGDAFGLDRVSVISCGVLAVK
jgi:hypothetical protein